MSGALTVDDKAMGTHFSPCGLYCNDLGARVFIDTWNYCMYTMLESTVLPWCINEMVPCYDPRSAVVFEIKQRVLQVLLFATSGRGLSPNAEEAKHSNNISKQQY